MSRDIPALPWTDPVRLWFAGSLAMAAIALAAIYGGIGVVLRNVPEPFTTDQEGKS